MVYWVPCGGLEEAAARRPCWCGDPLCEQLRTVAQKFLFLSLCQVARGKNLGYSLSSVQGRVPRNHRVVAQLGSALDWGSRGRRFKSCQPDAEDALIGKTIDWSVFIIGLSYIAVFYLQRRSLLSSAVVRVIPVLVIKLLLSYFFTASEYSLDL